MANETLSEQVARLETDLRAYQRMNENQRQGITKAWAEREEFRLERDALKDKLKAIDERRHELAERCAVAEARVSGAAREGAREALTRLQGMCERGEMLTAKYSHFANDDDIRIFRDREYPAVPAEGERTRTDAKCVCGHPQTGHVYHEGACRTGVVCASGCEKFRPVPAPTPARKVVTIQGVEFWYVADDQWHWHWLKPDGYRSSSTTIACAFVGTGISDLKVTDDDIRALLALTHGAQESR